MTHKCKQSHARPRNIVEVQSFSEGSLEDRFGIFFFFFFGDVCLLRRRSVHDVSNIAERGMAAWGRCLPTQVFFRSAQTQHGLSGAPAVDAIWLKRHDDGHHQRVRNTDVAFPPQPIGVKNLSNAFSKFQLY